MLNSKQAIARIKEDLGKLRRVNSTGRRKCVTRKASPQSSSRRSSPNQNVRTSPNQNTRPSQYNKGHPVKGRKDPLCMSGRQGQLKDTRRTRSKSGYVQNRRSAKNLTRRILTGNIKTDLIKYIKDHVRVHGIPPQTALDFYKIVKEIGNGAFGRVFLAVHILTGLNVAIKVMSKEKDSSSYVRAMHEAFLMHKVRDPNVIRLLEVFESENHVYIVLEYVGGGDLLKLLKEKRRFEEEEAAELFSKIIQSVKACHSAQIAHRDIKLDNILLTDKLDVKLCDFGVSRLTNPGEKVNEQCGTPAYLAPEIMAKKEYDPFLVDIWSLGVVLFTMITGSVPFKAKSMQELHKLILKCEYSFPQFVSDEAKDLIMRMLQPIPKKRIPLADIINHQWLETVVEDFNRTKRICPTSRNSIMNQILSFGFPADYIKRSLMLEDVNHGTATYRLMELALV